MILGASRLREIISLRTQGSGWNGPIDQVLMFSGGQPQHALFLISLPLDRSRQEFYCRRIKGEYVQPALVRVSREIPAGRHRPAGIAGRIPARRPQRRVLHAPGKIAAQPCVSNRNLPFTWTINPYRGCEFACKYCYARYTHEFMEMRDGAEFEQKIYVKQHTAEWLRRELRRVRPGESISLGTATDPYQPAERRYEITRGILEEFALHRGFELRIVTKSNLVV